MKFTVHPEMFLDHIKLISTCGYTPLTVQSYAHLVRNGSPLPSKPIILTFDDGFADFYHFAFPVLQEFHIPSTVFVVTDYIGGTSKWLKSGCEADRKLLSWSQLSEIQRAGVECGSHSATHIHLDVAKTKVVLNEILISKDALEQKLGISVHTMAYPYGHYSRAIRQMVIEAGYSAACAVRNALSHTNDNLFSLARITVHNRMDLSTFSDLLAGKGLAFAPQIEYPWVTGWRLARRIQRLFT